jgi:hypothetical protein
MTIFMGFPWCRWPQGYTRPGKTGKVLLQQQKFPDDPVILLLRPFPRRVPAQRAKPPVSVSNDISAPRKR